MDPAPCRWQPTEHVARVCQSEGEPVSLALRTISKCLGSRPILRCDAADGSPWRGALVGPIKTWPSAWTSIFISSEETQEWLKAGDRVVEFVGAPVRRDGTPIEFPPLHVHHLHVKQQNITHYFETHGDYDPAYATRLPPGYCMLADERRVLGAEAVFNDVRFEIPGLAMATDTSRARPSWV